MGFGQGLEDFTNLPISSSSYQTGSFIGNNSITWNYASCRGDQKIDGKAICTGKSTSTIQAENIPNGIGSLSFKYRQAFSKSSSMTISINGVEVEVVNVNSPTVSTYTKDVSVSGDFAIELKTTERVIIDNIEWTAYESTGPQKPKVSLDLSNTSIEEGSSESIELTASLSEALDKVGTVDFSITGAGITADDYTLSATQLTIPAGETSASLSLNINDDSDKEGTETMTISLSNPSEGIQLGAVSKNLTIIDNDNTNTLVEFASTSVSKAEDAGAFNVALRLVNSSSEPTELAVSLAATNDITSYTQSITFAANATTANMTVVINDDDVKEANEKFVFTLNNVSGGNNAELGTNTSFTLTITDNDVSTGGTILANYVYLTPEVKADGKIDVKLTPKEYVQTVSASEHMNSVRIPEAYYEKALGLSGNTLRDEIKTIISTGAQAKSYDDVWTMCEAGDQNPKNSSQVWQMYVETGISKSAHVSGSTGWNREHTWAKSHGNFGTSRGRGTDGHHLRATDARENSRRGSRDFGNASPGYTPPKSARGDVARMIFYMATRWGMTVDDQCKSSESSARHGKLTDLLKWHEEDPVDPYEVRRNNVIFGYQHNRNPFIDHPELVQYIFGEAKADAWTGGQGATAAKIQIAGSLTKFGMVKFGEESAVQTFSISANELSENVSVSAPQHFQVSKDGINYSSSLSLAISSGELAATTISVKFVPQSATASSLMGNIEITSGDESLSLSVSGTEGDPSLIPTLVYEQDFNASSSDWLMHSVKSDEDWHYSTSGDRLQGRNSSVGMVMNNYSGDESSEDWLISPELQLSALQNAQVSYWMNSKYAGSTVEVLYSTNYAGQGDPNSANWTSVESLTSLPTEWAEKALNLSTVSENVRVAFKHTSGKGSGNSAVVCIDDFQVMAIAVPLEGKLSSNNTALEFPYTDAGSFSPAQTYELSFEKLEGDISVQASANYELSLDGMVWKSDLSIAKTEVSPLSIQVRYAPQTAELQGATGTISHKAKGAASASIALASAASTEIGDASKLAHDKTFDVVSWNVEWFGAPSKSKHASSFDQQLAAVSAKIIELDADVYALQELVTDDLNGDFMTPLVNKLNQLAGEELYVGILGPRYSHDFEEPNEEFPAQRVCYIYNKTSVENLEDFSMFSGLYEGSSTTSIDGYTGDASRFWASGRLPYMLNAKVTIDGVSENIKFVNIHGKCCSDSYSRKLADAQFLMDELNTNYTEDNIIILGDYNDFLSGSMSGQESPYASWFTTTDNFDHVLTSSSNIDHISISNELYDEFGLLTNNTSEGTASTSDHKPIMLRLKLNAYKSNIQAENTENLNFEYIDVDNGGLASAAKSYTLKASDLTADLSVSVTQPFQISLNGTDWTTSLTIAMADAESNEVKVRFNPTVAYTDRIEGNINHQTSGAKAVLIPVKAYGKPDNIAPEFVVGYPAIESLSSTSFVMNVKLNEAGKVYFVVLADHADQPSIEAVKAGTGALVAGSFAIETEAILHEVSGLTQNTDYDVYLLAEDDNQPMVNTAAAPVKLEVKTSDRTLLPFEYVSTVTKGEHYKSTGIPVNYYQEAQGTKATVLKSKLADIINAGYVSYPYEVDGRGDVPAEDRRFVTGEKPLDVYDILDEADRDPNNPTKVYMIYKELVYDADAKHLGLSGSQEKWNREHVYPQSTGGFKNARAPWGSGEYANSNIIENAGNVLALAQSDAHHLRSSDKNENSKRSNYPFANSTSGSKYEPPLSAKGDVARIIFYLNLRYGLDISKVGSVEMFQEWSEIDPVDPYEIRHNNVVYKYQKNRNPFIDYPELVDYIYGDKTTTAWEVAEMQNQTITFADIADKVYGDEAFELTATATSGLDVRFEIVSGPASLEGKTLTISGAGDVVIKAFNLGNEIYLAAEQNRTLHVLKADQGLTFDPIDDYVFGEESKVLNASSSSLLPIEFEITEGVGVIDVNVFTPSEIGQFTIRAYQDGNENYNSAEQSQSFLVDRATGIDDVFVEEIQMYPNPAVDYVLIDFPDAELKQIKVLNVKGQVLKTTQAHQNLRLNVQDLKTGLYFITIQTDESVITKRFVKVNN